MRISAKRASSLGISLRLGPKPVVALERRSMASVLGPLRTVTAIDVACGTGEWLLVSNKPDRTYSAATAVGDAQRGTEKYALARSGCFSGC